METVIASQFDMGYRFSLEEIREAVTPEYAEFLKEAGYVDLKKLKEGLFVADKLLRDDDKVKEAAEKQAVDFYDNEGYVTCIEQGSVRKLIHAFEGRILTSAFMYGLLIPNLKLAAEQGNVHAEATLAQMEDEYSEYLEDRILNFDTLVIGSAKRTLNLIRTNGRFSKENLNGYGYPNVVKENGEFRYWFPRVDEIAAIRSRDDSGPDLDLSGVPGLASEWLGVRFAKFS